MKDTITCRGYREGRKNLRNKIRFSLVFPKRAELLTVLLAVALLVALVGLLPTPVSAISDYFVITGSSSQTAGMTQDLTITATNGGGTDTSYIGSHDLTFSGASSSTNPATAPTVKNNAGTAVAFGASTTIDFSSGVATVSSDNNGVMALYKAEIVTIDVTDGFITSSGGNGLSVTVSAASMNKFEFVLASPQTNGLAFTGTNTLTAEDAWGNTVIFDASGNNVTITSSPPDGTITGLGSLHHNVLNEAWDFSNGVATLSTLVFTGTSGSHTFTALAFTGGYTGTSGSVTINAGAASVAHSMISASPTSILADGASHSTITVQARDANDNNLTTGGATVVISKASGGGLLGGTSDNSNGTYTATLTSAASPGSATFTATLNGTAVGLGSPATVNYTALAPTFASAATDIPGNIIIITFSKAMADPSGKQGQFSYTVGGVGPKTFSTAALHTGNTTRIDLTTTDPGTIASGDSVKVSYAAGTVLAADGGVLATFTDQTVLNNVPSPPTFTSAATNNYGNIITITFSKPMANPSGKQAQFSYTVNGVGPKTFSTIAFHTGDTGKFDLTTSAAGTISNGNLVKVSYTAGTVLAADGGVLATFTDQTVLNNVPPAPTITDPIAPTSGPAGTLVTINGTNFTTVTQVKFGGTSASSWTTNPAGNQIIAVAGAGTTGTISVTNPGGTATSADTFTFVVPPTISSFTPTSGMTGASVTINGTNLTGATAVTFGGTAASGFTVNLAGTQITAVVGTGSTGKISVTTPGGTATSAATFTFITAPTFVSATANNAGNVITITFSRPMTNPAGKQAQFSYRVNGVGPKTFSTIAFHTGDTSKFDLTTSLPGTIVSGNTVTISYTAGSISAADGGVLATFTNQPVTVPAVPTFVSAATNTAGNVITIAFSKAMASPAGKQVQFSYKVNGVGPKTFSAAALHLGDTTRIDLTTSASGTIASGNTVTVSYTAGNVAAADGTVLATFTNQLVTNIVPHAPTISSFTPPSGKAGTSVTINGTYFSGATSVRFGGIMASSFTVNPAGTQVIAVASIGSTGKITVTTPGGTATSAGNFTITP